MTTTKALVCALSLGCVALVGCVVDRPADPTLPGAGGGCGDGGEAGAPSNGGSPNEGGAPNEGGGGAAPAPGPGQAIDFGGGPDRIAASDAGLPTGEAPRTVEAWVRTSATSGEQYYVAYGTLDWNKGFYLGILGGHAVITQIGQSFTGATMIADGAWHHLAVVYGGASEGYELYVDGELDGSGNMTTGTVLGGLVVGSTVTGENKPAVATVDEVRIWDHARSQSDIQATMAATLSGDEDGLLVYYDMEAEGQGANIAVANRAATGSAYDGATQGTATTPSFVESGAWR